MLDIKLANGELISYPISAIDYVTFHTEDTPGDGSQEHPFSVAEALVAYQTQTSAQQVWVKGVIVGSVPDISISNAVLGTDTCSNTNLLIANTRWETSVSRCLVVQLPTGAVRTALSLVGHPDNIYHEVLLYGSLEKYFGVAGLKSVTKYELGAEASTLVGTETRHPGRIEVPALIDGDEFVTHTAFTSDATTQRVPTFYVSYSPTQHHSHWVAFRFDDITRQKTVTRSNVGGYPGDPECQSSLPSSAFSGTGYDHGHLCASADRLYSTLANEQTFYMTNMSPQIGQFNRTYWNYYETYVQNLAHDATFSDTLYVVKGGTIEPDQISTHINCNGISVPVPKYYFMALLKVKNNQYSALAFWMEHREYDTVSDQKAEMRKHAISINELQRLTGYNFFPALPDATEKTVEEQLNLLDWGL